jgi:hypothetical protein
LARQGMRHAYWQGRGCATRIGKAGDAPRVLARPARRPRPAAWRQHAHRAPSPHTATLPRLSGPARRRRRVLWPSRARAPFGPERRGPPQLCAKGGLPTLQLVPSIGRGGPWLHHPGSARRAYLTARGAERTAASHAEGTMVVWRRQHYLVVRGADRLGQRIEALDSRVADSWRRLGAQGLGSCIN